MCKRVNDPGLQLLQAALLPLCRRRKVATPFVCVKTLNVHFLSNKSMLWPSAVVSTATFLLTLTCTGGPGSTVETVCFRDWAGQQLSSFPIPEANEGACTPLRRAQGGRRSFSINCRQTPLANSRAHWPLGQCCSPNLLLTLLRLFLSHLAQCLNSEGN